MSSYEENRVPSLHSSSALNYLHEPYWPQTSCLHRQSATQICSLCSTGLLYAPKPASYLSGHQTPSFCASSCVLPIWVSMFQYSCGVEFSRAYPKKLKTTFRPLIYSSNKDHSLGSKAELQCTPQIISLRELHHANSNIPQCLDPNQEQSPSHNIHYTLIMLHSLRNLNRTRSQPNYIRMGSSLLVLGAARRL